MKKKGYLSSPVAFCAMMSALGTVIMLSGGLIPVLTYCSPLIASVLLIPVLFQYGSGKAWMVWIVTALLTLLIDVDKEAAFFYIFLAWYPIVKPYLDRIPSRLLRICAKLLVFSTAVFGMYGIICFVLRIDEITATFSAVRYINILFLMALVVVMMLYDRVLIGIAALYIKRILPKIRKGK